MNKKGFTLIELLAVIVLLAIISLIAIPIVLNMIKDTKESSFKASVDGIIRAASAKAIVQSNNDEVVYKYKNSNWLSSELKISTKKPKYIGISIDKNGNKKVAITDGKYCAFKDYKDSDLTYKKIGLENTDNTIKEKDCVLEVYMPVTEATKTTGNIPDSEYNVGDEYIINVDGTNKYHFFILSIDDDNVNLILDRNICSDGTLATENNLCNVEWYSSHTNMYGPIIAMDYLNEATKNWKNIPNINIDYIDEGNTGTFGYGTIKTTNTTTTITNKDATEVATYENLKARLPKLSELINLGCTTNSGSCPLWIGNNLNSSRSRYGKIPIVNNITGIGGYWSLSSSNNDSKRAILVFEFGDYLSNYAPAKLYGVRPVISISKSDF